MYILFILAIWMAFKEQEQTELKEQRNASPQQIMVEARPNS